MDAPRDKAPGFLRKPALLTPAVGFLAFLVLEAARSPSTAEPLGDALIALPIVLVVATIAALIPMIVAAAGLLVILSLLPDSLVRIALLRMSIGGSIGVLVGLPFTYVLNFIPSATAEPRFSYLSMLVACAIAGGYAAIFYSASGPAAPPESLERTRER